MKIEKKQLKKMVKIFLCKISEILNKISKSIKCRCDITYINSPEFSPAKDMEAEPLVSSLASIAMN